MFKPKKEAQNEMEFVIIDDLVPQDHLLRKVDNNFINRPSASFLYIFFNTLTII